MDPLRGAWFTAACAAESPNLKSLNLKLNGEVSRNRNSGNTSLWVRSKL